MEPEQIFESSAGWCKTEKKTRVHDTSPSTLTGSSCAFVVDLITQVTGAEWLGETIIYAYKSGEAVWLPKATTTIALRVKGKGRFGIYSSQSPLKCVVGGTEADFSYDSWTGLTTFSIPFPLEEMYRWSIEIQ
ncbi:putative galactinol--sucrose galactosyltransferase 2, partial [Mucuna pruriens]